MVETICDRVRDELALDERPLSTETRTHLAACAACRKESAALVALHEGLRRTAIAEPSPEVDLRMRRLLLGHGAGRPFASPLVAGGVAAGGLLALVTGLASLLVGTGAVEQGVPVAVAIITSYLAISSAAALPLLFSRRLREVLQGQEAEL
jgi:anti-sigma factor RsiW